MTKALLEQENEQYQGQVYQLLGQIGLLKQQSLPNTNAGSDLEVTIILRQELERQREEMKQEINELKNMLKQALSAQPKQKIEK